MQKGVFCFRFVFSFCVFALCFRFVFSFCVFVLCFRFVFSLCVFALCFRFVFSFVFSLSVFVLKTPACRLAHWAFADVHMLIGSFSESQPFLGVNCGKKVLLLCE